MNVPHLDRALFTWGTSDNHDHGTANTTEIALDRGLSVLTPPPASFFISGRRFTLDRIEHRSGRLFAWHYVTGVPSDPTTLTVYND